MKVIDISKHQHSFDACQAKKLGVEAVLIRLAYAGSRDKLACSWSNDIKAAGLKLGGYGFATWHYKSMCNGSVSRARDIMHTQVAAWIKAAREAGVNWWLAVDQELEKGETMALSMDDNTKLLAEAAELIRSAGFAPCLYCSVAWDYDHIRTTGLPEWLPYWFAYYPKAMAAAGFDGANMDGLPDGKYSRWMRKVRAAGRLCGWQYGSTGWGQTLGCCSANVDRDIFYFEPSTAPISTVQLHSITTGGMSAGDLHAVEAVLQARQIEYTVNE